MNIGVTYLVEPFATVNRELDLGLSEMDTVDACVAALQQRRADELESLDRMHLLDGAPTSFLLRLRATRQAAVAMIEAALTALGAPFEADEEAAA